MLGWQRKLALFLGPPPPRPPLCEGLCRAAFEGRPTLCSSPLQASTLSCAGLSCANMSPFPLPSIVGPELHLQGSVHNPCPLLAGPSKRPGVQDGLHPATGLPQGQQRGEGCVGAAAQHKQQDVGGGGAGVEGLHPMAPGWQGKHVQACLYGMKRNAGCLWRREKMGGLSVA